LEVIGDFTFSGTKTEYVFPESLKELGYAVLSLGYETTYTFLGEMPKLTKACNWYDYAIESFYDLYLHYNLRYKDSWEPALKHGWYVGTYTPLGTFWYDSETDEYFDCGDVNTDGTINTGDAVAILKEIVGPVEFSERQRLLSDTNFDGKEADTGDAVVILHDIVTKKYASQEFSMRFNQSNLTEDWIANDWYDDFMAHKETDLIFKIKSHYILSQFRDIKTCKIAGGVPYGGEYQEIADITSKYDPKFFENNTLAFFHIHEGAESLYVEVQNVRMERNKLIIEVNQYYNQIVNQISGNKLIMLELDNIAFGTFDDVEINITKVFLGERTTQ
jgi:hypothetical protein